MIKLGAEHPLLRTCRRILEAGEQEYVLDTIGLGPLHPLRLLCAMTSERENHKIPRTGPSDEAIDRREDGRSIRHGIDQRSDILNPGPSQSVLDIQRVGGGPLQRTDMSISIYSYDQGSNRAAIRAPQLQILVAERRRDGQAKRDSDYRHQSDESQNTELQRTLR
jgi:hypothetical protein